MDVAGKWVLVVDDDEDTREIVVECLRSEGYLAVAAPGAVSALRMMRQGVPALVLSDLIMGEMEPYGLAELLTVVGHHVQA